MDISMSKKYQEELLNYYNMQKNKTPDNADEIPRPENESDEISERYPEPDIEQFRMPEENPEDISMQEQYSEYGKLRIETTSGNRSVPVEDVLVIVTRGSETPAEVIAVLMTDSSGATRTLEIPAPSRQRSESPTDRTVSAFVNITAFKKGYYEVENRNIPIFTGVTSIQPVNMIPLPLNSGNLKFTYTEPEPNL